MKIDFIIAHKRNNVAVLFGTLKVQSFMLSEVRDCDLLIVEDVKVEDVTTISKPQSLTSVRIKDCTFRVPNKTTTLCLSEKL